MADSDDGYGDSSDLLYDAEEDEGGEGITSLTSEIKEVLGENVNVLDQVATFIQENESLSLVPEGHAKLVDVPKLQLDGQQDDVHSFVDEDLPESAGASYVPDEKPLLKSVDYQEFSVREIESPEIEENLPKDSHDPKPEEKDQVEEEIDIANGGSVSLVEVSEKTYIETGPRSLGDVTAQHETTTAPPVGLFSEDNCTEALDPINFNLPAKSESDFASFDYSDDFEDFQEESEATGKEKDQPKESISPSSQDKECPPKALPETPSDPVPTIKTTAPTERISSSQDTQKQASHRSNRDLVPRKVQSPPVERRKKNSSSEPSKPASSDTTRSKPKRAGASTPVIKPALLSSAKLNTIKSSDSGRHKSRSTTPASSASSSPLSSASSSASSSSSSSASSYSVSRARGRSRTSINGPVRPTAHRSSGSTTKGSSSGIGGGGSSPVRPPTSGPHNSLAVASSGPALGGRLAPPARVRKAASASDLHK